MQEAARVQAAAPRTSYICIDQIKHLVCGVGDVVVVVVAIMCSQVLLGNELLSGLT